jgi:putative membrane protein
MSAGAGDSRRPRSVYGVGEEPDPRFSMANERTALAWARTALAMVAGGVGLMSVAPLTGAVGLSRVISAVLSLLGGVLAVSSVLGWMRRETALRTGRPLPGPVVLPWVAGVIVVLAGVLAGFALAAL